MYAALGMAAANAIEVGEYLVGDERSNGRGQQHHGFETGIERLVGCRFVSRGLSAPEPFAIEAHVPVAQLLVHEVLNSASGAGWLVVLVGIFNLNNEAVEERQYPAVDFGALLHRHLGLLVIEPIHIGVEGKERVGVVERAEEFALNLLYALHVEL